MENDEILISIITPVYNSEKYIGDTIKSVLEQTYKNWEMLIVDDCSFDNTEQIIKQFQDSRIKYFKLEENCGAAIARNKALNLARGNFIAFLDADDMWNPKKLEKQLNFMLEKNYAFTFTAYEILRKDGNKMVEIPSSLNYSQFMKNTIIGMLTVMIDRRKITDLQIVNVKKDHDSMTWAKLLRSGYVAYGLNENLAYYRKVEGSISNNKIEAVKNHWINCRNIENIPFTKCVYFFCFYILNACKKHLF
ncbi:glycosyltransferase family 2 protein [Turicibacter sanguinis]|uniref:glycosyltransferase family 2 protein n=1 Tax=Turicibacter sanguinis TaxID=154288 RepID=UPI0018AABCF2|nr:glycosyltransferase family 2 protein [Turicibacter sanguinis]